MHEIAFLNGNMLTLRNHVLDWLFWSASFGLMIRRRFVFVVLTELHHAQRYR